MPLRLHAYDPDESLKERAYQAMSKIVHAHQVEVRRWEADQKFKAHQLEALFERPRRKRK